MSHTLTCFYFFLLCIGSFSLASAQTFEDHVVIVGNGSGVVLNTNNAITARHVIHQMDYVLGKNDNPICHANPTSPIGNYDNYGLTYLPPASVGDKESLTSGRIDFDTLDEYNDWGAVSMAYMDEMPYLEDTASVSSLQPGSPLIAIGHLSFTKRKNRTIKFVKAEGKVIVFSYEANSFFGRGFSGGGLFTEDGKLVGIIFAMNEANRTGAATAIRYIEDELRQNCSSLVQ